MKTHLTAILFLVQICTTLTAQDYAYKSITLKTNIINLYNIALEIPLYKRFTAEASGRYYQGFNLFAIPEMTSQRLNLHYHFPLGSSWRTNPSFFISCGLNKYWSHIEYFPSERNEKAVQTYSVLKASFGLGFKARRISFWIAYEPLLSIYQNEYKLYPDIYPYGTPIKQGKAHDTPPTPFAACLAINLVNIKIPQ